ncbi:hypothetical protein V1517DRAFT_307233 [Lipomyces orientalis]|uniref:Uncharacterized protein n=1 Tax=Lipomyces orientalis TaxID=1233043 RepID=A0ACC3TQ50_9ASCO
MSSELRIVLPEGDNEAQLMPELAKAPKAMSVIGSIREFWESMKPILAWIGLGFSTVIGLAFIILGAVASSDQLIADSDSRVIASSCMQQVIILCMVSMQFILKRAELVRDLRPATYLKRSVPVVLFVKCSFYSCFLISVCAVPLALGSTTFIIEGLDSSNISSIASVTLGMSLMIMSTMCILVIIRTHTQDSSIGSSPDEDAEFTALLAEKDYNSKENHSIKASDPWHSTKRIIARVFVGLSPVVGTAFFIIGAVGATEKLSDYCSANALAFCIIFQVIVYCMLSMQFIMRQTVLKVDLQPVPGLKKSAPMDRTWVRIFYFVAPVATFGAVLMTFGIEGEDAPPIMNAASMTLGISLVILWVVCNWCTRYHLTLLQDGE